MPPTLTAARMATTGDTGWKDAHPSPGSPGPMSAGQPDFPGAKLPGFKRKEVREQTFSSGTGWPTNKSQSPAEMAEAGFFFAGIADCTRCFYCGAGLRNWMPYDDPAVEHARWGPTCRYIRWLKGDEFVNNVDENYPRIQIASNSNGSNGSSSSDTNRPMDDLNMIINGVMMRPCCHALKKCGYSKDLIKDAISKVLSENGWDDMKMTSEQLTLATVELSAARVKGDKKPEDSITGAANQRVMEIAVLVKQEGSDGVPSPTTSIDSIDTDVEVAELTAENFRMKSALTCKICMDATVSILFLPCGHIATCSDCSSRQRKCPICRSEIATFTNVCFNGRSLS